MQEPKPKHAGLVIGVAIAAVVGVIQGAKMKAASTNDFIALVIAFFIVIGLFAGIGFLIDRYIHKKHKKDYKSFITQEQFNYGDEGIPPEHGEH